MSGHNTSRYTGKDLYVEFAGAILTGDQRTFSISKSADTAEKTAGSEEAKSYIATLDDATASMELLDAGGTLLSHWGIDVGTEGTLSWAPKGSASGNPLRRAVAIVTGVDEEWPYDDMVTISLNWQLSGTFLDGYAGTVP